MPLRPGHCAVQEEDWEIVGRDWWRTSFRDVPWSYVPTSDALAKKPRRRKFLGPLLYNPSRRLDSTTPLSGSLSKEGRLSDEDDSLNIDHVGVKSALDAVVAYERDVGFYFTGLPEISLEDLNLSAGADLTVEVDEKELVAGNKRKWDELLEELMNGPAFDSTTDSDESIEGSFVGSLSSSGELHRSTSTFSTMTFSDGSIDSVGMPSTPKPKALLHDIEIKDTSPSGSISGSIDYNPHTLSPTRSLNAAASSFVPTFCSQLNDEPLQYPTLADKPKSSFNPSSSSDSFANFTFPTLNPHAPPIKVKKDDGLFSDPQGYNSTSSDSGNGLLPPFLQEPYQRNRSRKSRTREIVDRLRSRLSPVDGNAAVSQAQPSSTLSPKYASHSPSPIGEEPTFVAPRLSVSEDGGDRVSRLSSPSCGEEDDGWIDVSQPSVTSSSSSSSSSQKSKRARELLFALTRRRTDSLTSENLKEMASSTSEAAPATAPNRSRQTQNGLLSPSPSPAPHTPSVPVTTADGWIESSTSASPPSETQKKTKPHQNPKDANQHHGQAHAHHTHAHNRKKSSNHTSRASTSSAPHLHPPPHFSAPPPCYPHATAPLPAPPPHALPYFFPAYPAVGMPVGPYAAFMQVPAYHHLSAMSMHAGAPAGPMQFAGMQPGAAAAALGMQQQQPLRAAAGPASVAAMKPSMASSGPGAPVFRGKHSQPLW